jgi:O-succinylbenzoate synthase
VQVLARFELAYVEQPLARGDLPGHASLARNGELTVALDESATSEGALEAIATSRAAAAVNLKLSRLGGPRAAVSALARARELGLDAWCGGMLETGVGRAVALAVAAQPGFTLPSDLGPSERYFADDIVEPPAAIDDDGAVAVPQGPGLGARVRVEVLDALTERRWSAGDTAA